MEIKNEGLPARCEVCHQSDLFDPARNYCRRCNDNQSRRIEVAIPAASQAAMEKIEGEIIIYKEFVPRVISGGISAGGLFQEPNFESFHHLVAAASTWVRNNSIKVINIETVVLPNIFSTEEEGSKDTSLRTVSGNARWHQIVRVWFWHQP